MIIQKQIKTKDFILRPFKKGDEFSLAKNINDKGIIRNTLIPFFPYTLKHAKDWVKKSLKEGKKKKPQIINFVIDINGEVVGSVGFSKIEGHRAMVGYWLARKYWNRGIMTKATKLVTKFGFEKLNYKRIYGYVFSFNKPSMKVLKKAGYKFEGILKKNTRKGNRFIDDHLFAKVK